MFYHTPTIENEGEQTVRLDLKSKNKCLGKPLVTISAY